MQFEWDPAKAVVNRRKHGVSFEEAITVFYDRLTATLDDATHYAGEQRFLTIGYSARGRLLIVCHADRAGVVRLIGAWPATYRERKRHESEE